MMLAWVWGSAPATKLPSLTAGTPTIINGWRHTFSQGGGRKEDEAGGRGGAGGSGSKGTLKTPFLSPPDSLPPPVSVMALAVSQRLLRGVSQPPAPVAAAG